MNKEMYSALLQPLSLERVANRKQGGMSLAYLEAWDVKAHLIRYFGFGGWSSEVVESALAFEDKNEKNWTVAYKVVLKLTLHNFGPWGQEVIYTEGAVGSAIGSRAEAHDNAIKTAESDALKRCAINLGTAFGLSLYNKGSRVDVVKFTYHAPDGWEASSPKPVEEEVPALSDDAVASALRAQTREELRPVWDACSALGNLDSMVDSHGFSGITMRELMLTRLSEIDSEQNEGS